MESRDFESYIAIFTNRTLVLPPFYKHTRNDKTSEGLGDIAKPGMRVDVNSVRRLLSTNDGSKAAKKCQKSFDAVFQGGKRYCKVSGIHSTQPIRLNNHFNENMSLNY